MAFRLLVVDKPYSSPPNNQKFRNGWYPEKFIHDYNQYYGYGFRPNTETKIHLYKNDKKVRVDKKYLNTPI